MPAQLVADRDVQITVPVDKGQVVASFDPADFAEPTGREEDWRFTPMRRMGKLLSPLERTDGAVVTIVGTEGIASDNLAQGPIEPGRYLVPIDLPSALAWSGASALQLVTVPPNTVVDEPIVVTIAGTDDSYQALRITVEHDSAVSIVLDHRGTGSHSTNVEIEVGARANVTVTSIQDWDRDAVHLGRIHTHVGRDATVTQVVATFGGDLVRIVSTVSFDGPGGSIELLGALFADAGQHFEHRLFVDHSAPNCRSSVIYKGALQGEHAHSVWIGDVLIRAKAVGTSTYEINRNLILTDGARADSVPNLEIETGEVAGAGHASTTGRFDDEQLFYLQARGIPVAVARRLVVRGFFADVLDRVPTEEVRARLWQTVDNEVAAVDSGGSR